MRSRLRRPSLETPPLARWRLIGGLLLSTVTFAFAGTTPPQPPLPNLAGADLDFFETRIRPILTEHCYRCHSHEADKVKGGLLLDTREGLLHGGYSGDAVIPGDPENSLLILAVSYEDEDLQMPPKGKKLSNRQIADLIEWVRRGAPDPRTRLPAGSPARYAGVGRDHWAFQPVEKPPVPTVRNTGWCRTDIDRFILARLEAAGIAPNPPTDRHTLLRRLSYNLTGLPPTRAEMAAFLADSSPDAVERVIDRLLASPQYGEHWARYWLDLARYADTRGDPPRREDPRFPHAWTYRDYVIDAFNRDLPYDQFILEQLAADRLLPAASRHRASPASSETDRTRLAALGFLTLGNQFDGRRNDIIADQIDVTTKAFLGLTVACARCHDHKFDPIPTEDYYSLYGVFANSVVPRELPILRPAPSADATEDYLARRREWLAREQELLLEFRNLRRSGNRDPERRRQLIREQQRVRKNLTDLESTHPGAPVRAHVLFDVDRPRDYPVLIRGEPGNAGKTVPRRFLEILSPGERPPFRDGSGRLELARAIASPDNPLTARVIVNRIWQQHFGAGIIDTPDDFGNMAAPPTHPELLDFLAAGLIEHGWSLKWLQREITRSAVYQLSCLDRPDAAAIDPENHLLWRANLRRLSFEQIHDALLAAAGTLDLSRVGGKSVRIGSADFATRRALYTWIDRRNPAELLTQFDFPSPDIPSGRRHSTIVPQQSLFLMNSPIVVEAARALVQNDTFRNLPDDEARVRALYLAIFQRPPIRREVDLCRRYIHANPDGASLQTPPPTRRSRLATRAALRQARLAERAEASGGRFRAQIEPAARAHLRRDPLDAWTKLAHALLQTNEAVFLN